MPGTVPDGRASRAGNDSRREGPAARRLAVPRRLRCIQSAARWTRGNATPNWTVTMIPPAVAAGLGPPHADPTITWWLTILQAVASRPSLLKFALSSGTGGAA